MNRDVILAIVATLVVIPAVPAAAETGEARVGAAATLFQYLPSVIAASRAEQRREEAPSSLSIVTAGEIRKYVPGTKGRK